jgi:hypothetical protein
MYDQEEEARTVAVKACSECASGLLERDKFCRWCGARQPIEAPLQQNRVQESALIDDTRGSTVPVTASVRTEAYRTISGPLVEAIVTGALSVPSTANQNAMVKRLILALISIPIWLMIVLLSPLDAYATLKTLARQV